jgi:3',5'-cyclic-AMP phosphodiesterase
VSPAALRILQITDPHLYGAADGRMHGVCTADSLERVLRQALADPSPPQLILATGDLVQDETAAGYARLRDILGRTGVPVACIPGNHDDPTLLQNALATTGIQLGGHQDHGPWRLVLLSSWCRDNAGGELPAAELQRVQSLLAGRPDAHALIVLHHHPVPTGSRWLDTVPLHNSAELFQTLDQHSQVRGVLWGHVHQAMDQQRQGVRLLGTPSTCYQFLPGSADFAVDSRPPGYRWLDLHGDGTISTRVVWLE